MSSEYGPDLAYIHHTGFGEFAESAAPGLLGILRKHCGAAAPGGDRRRGRWRHTVVDVGCGSGIWARALIRAGFDVLGIDASPSMIALAQEFAPQARFEVGTFASARIPPCAAVTAIGEVLNYGRVAELPPFFARVAAAGAMLVFDVAERDAYPPYDEVRVDGKDFVVIAVKESDGVRLTRRVTTYRESGGRSRRTREVHELELYHRAEVTRLLREAGFRVRRRRSYGTRRLPKGHGVYVATPI